jgi:hypothetical protein
MNDVITAPALERVVTWTAEKPVLSTLAESAVEVASPA